MYLAVLVPAGEAPTHEPMHPSSNKPSTAIPKILIRLIENIILAIIISFPRQKYNIYRLSYNRDYLY